jgi:peroxiredoxin
MPSLDETAAGQRASATESGARAAVERLTIRQLAAERMAKADGDQRFLKASDRAPHFELPDLSGLAVSSAELLQAGPLVVTFYRGLWCPFCQKDIEGIEASAEAIKLAGASVLAVCRQTTIRASAVAAAGRLSFPVLNDESGRVAVAFGLRWSDEELVALREGYGASLVDFIGGENWILPMQARYVVGQDQVVAYADVLFQYDDSTDTVGLMSVLRTLSAEGAG